MVRTPRFHCRGPGSIPGQGTKILHAVWHGQKKKETGEISFNRYLTQYSQNIIISTCNQNKKLKFYPTKLSKAGVCFTPQFPSPHFGYSVAPRGRQVGQGVSNGEGPIQVSREAQGDLEGLSDGLIP